MELLILKSDQAYIRFKDEDYLAVKLDKASVFPLDRMELVKKHEIRLREKGFLNVSIKKLVLTEEDL